MMQNPNHNGADDKFSMNFGNFDTDTLFSAHMGGTITNMGLGMKRSAHDAGLDREPMGLSSDDENDMLKKDDKMNASSSRDTGYHHPQHTSLEHNTQAKNTMLPNGKKTKGRVKIKMEFIDNKLRRYTTFSKRKTGIMKKAYELSTLTGTQVMLLVASETGHVYTFATRKLQPMITSEAGKALIQTCLNSPDPPPISHHHHDQRMSATGYEETELTYAVTEDDHKSPSNLECIAGGSSSESDLSVPSSPAPASPGEPPVSSTGSSKDSPFSTQAIPVHLPPGLVLTSSVPGGSMLVRGSGGNVVYAASGGMVYAAPKSSLADGPPPLVLNLPPGLQITPEQGSSGNPRLVTLPMNLASATAIQQSASIIAAAVENHNANQQQALPTDLSLNAKKEKPN